MAEMGKAGSKGLGDPLKTGEDVKKRASRLET